MHRNNEIGMHEVGELTSRIQNAKALVKSVVQPEDAVILVGNTKIGKSTVINYLMGNKLKAVKSKVKFNLVKADDSDGPEIGMDPVSKTYQPRRFVSEVFNFVLYDVPGFCDNRSNWQDIINSVLICELLQSLKSTKIILIISWDDLINDDIALLLRSFDGLENLLGENMKNCFSNIGIMFSKVDGHEQVNEQSIFKILQDQLLSNDQLNLSPTVKDFIWHLINNSRKIGIFHRPLSGDVVVDGVDSGIIDSINSVEYMTQEILKQVSTNISEASESFLFKLRDQFYDRQSFARLQELVSNYLRNIYVPKRDVAIQSESEVDQFSCDLRNLRDKVNQYFVQHLSNIDKVNVLKIFDSSIATFIDQNNFVQRINCIETIDQLLNNAENQLVDVHLRCTFTDAQRYIDDNLAAVEARKVRIHEEQVRALQEEVDRKAQEQEQARLEAAAAAHREEIRRLQAEIERVNTYREERRKDKCSVS